VGPHPPSFQHTKAIETWLLSIIFQDLPQTPWRVFWEQGIGEKHHRKFNPNTKKNVNENEHEK